MNTAADRRPRAELVEVVTPRTNAATITPAENLLAAISLAEPFALEIAATGRARWFLVRAGSPAMRRHLEDQLGVAYPQAELRRLDVERFPGLDPARRSDDEQVAACALVLRGPPYLPLRTFADAQVDAARSSQADPVLGLLGAAGDLPEGWRTLHQLVLRPAPDDWCRPYLRLALEHPIAAERFATGHDTSLRPVVATAGLIATLAAALQGYQWYAAGDWLELGLLVGGLALAAPGAFWLARRLGRRELHDPKLVQEKIGRIAYRTQIRLAVVAPGEAPPEVVAAYLGRLAAAYRQYSLAAGNGLVPAPLRLQGGDLRGLDPLPPARGLPVLNTRELAGLWHLPQAGADVPLVERTAARQRLPLPCTVGRGCRIGVSAHQGHQVPVSLPDELLRRHLLLVAKTRRGKSSLLLRIARYLMEAEPLAGRRPALVLVDPHRDLAESALGCVPPERRGDVVYLDVAQEERPFGLNLLDVGLGWERDKAVSNVLDIFRHEWGRNWGPRMEDAFRYALMTLFEANEVLCDAGERGASHQFTILDVPAVLAETAFRRRLLEMVEDPVIEEWWARFDYLDRRLQMEIQNPVQTKVHKFAGSRAARAIVGQPRSTIDPAAWLREGKIVLVNTAKGVVGEDTAALVGGTLLNLVALVVGEQAELRASERRPLTMVVDEFHTMPGADYESILAELPKYGANLVLATQSLARLEALDREHQRALHATVFANLDGLFAFHVSAEDARYLVHELGEGVDEEDLVALGEHRCYTRLSAAGARLPAFSVQLDPPPAAEAGLPDRLASESAATYGRDRVEVEQMLRRALELVASFRRRPAERPAEAADGEHPTDDASTRRQRTRRRPGAAGQKSPRSDAAGQAPLFEAASGPEPPTEPATAADEGAGPDGRGEPTL